jgi:hypothetical protein
VGAAVYLVDRIAGNAIDRLGRYRYRVAGPWSNPDISRVGWDPAVGADTSVAPADTATSTLPATLPATPPTTNHFLE